MYDVPISNQQVSGSHEMIAMTKPNDIKDSDFSEGFSSLKVDEHGIPMISTAVDGKCEIFYPLCDFLCDKLDKPLIFIAHVTLDNPLTNDGVEQTYVVYTNAFVAIVHCVLKNLDHGVVIPYTRLAHLYSIV